MMMITKDSFKDYKKYLTTSLKLYLFVLIILVILKLVGISYFKLDVSHPALLNINNFLSKYKIDYVYQCLGLYFSFYLIKSIILKNYKFNLDVIIISTINILMFFTLKYFHIDVFYQVMNITLLFVYFVIKKAKIKRIIGVFIFNIFCQWFSIIIRNYNIQDYDNILLNAVMNIDYYIMLLILYSIEKQGGAKICQEVGSYSQKKIHLKKSLKKLQKSYSNFKLKSKENKFATILYFILSFIWNVLNVLLVLYVSMFNETFVECIFILSSFFISKKLFGKAFHLTSMCKCFIISNFTYYCLNRITTPIGISIFVPILLGVGLAYFTSKLVSKSYKPLYKGMSENLFNDSILKVVDENSNKYKICYDFYISKNNALVLSRKYKYTEAGIRKIISRVNDKIKELNK